MPNRLTVDERLKQLRDLSRERDHSRIQAAVIQALADKTNLIIAQAAQLIYDLEISGAEPALVAAWQRLVKHPDPIKADKGCRAKEAIIQALGHLGYDNPDLSLEGLVYKQTEPAWPKAVDTADNVRAGCAFALARSRGLRIIDKLNAFVGYLQGERVDRLNACKAIADTGHESGIPLLRMKLLADNDFPDVLGTCMTGLMTLNAKSSLPVVSNFLDHDNEQIVVEAAVALGTCGLSEAVNLLIDRYKRGVDDEIRRSLLISIGLSRHALATDFLVEQLHNNALIDSILLALKPACMYDETRRKVRQSLESFNDTLLIKRFDRTISN